MTPQGFRKVVIVSLVLAVVAALLIGMTRGSPRAVKAALQGEKKDYVGEWTTQDEKLSAELTIDATGEISYDESAALRESRGQQGAYVADDFYIDAFEGDDIVVTWSFRIKVTSKPHVVGDHLEMTANDLIFVRAR